MAAAVVGVPCGKAPKGFGEHVCVKIRARFFGDDWAKETFGGDWTTAWCHGVIVSEAGRHEWNVQFEGDEPGDTTKVSTRELQRDKNPCDTILEDESNCLAHPHGNVLPVARR
eukprot:COSAG01_NODE_5261_length_4376_cov_137.949497_1_plen_113_part_00